MNFTVKMKKLVLDLMCRLDKRVDYYQYHYNKILKYFYVQIVNKIKKKQLIVCIKTE